MTIVSAIRCDVCQKITIDKQIIWGTRWFRIRSSNDFDRYYDICNKCAAGIALAKGIKIVDKIAEEYDKYYNIGQGDE